jgi:hypothetical protein
MFYEGVRKIVLAVAVQWDRIHKGLRNIFRKICTAPFEHNKCECLTKKNNKFGHLLQNSNNNCPIWAFYVNLQLNLAFLAKE